MKIFNRWRFIRQNTRVGSCVLLQGIFNLGIKPRSPTLKGRFFTAESPRSGDTEIKLKIAQ